MNAPKFLSRLPYLGILTLLLALPVLLRAQTPQENRQRIQKAFDDWANGKGTAYDLVSDDVQWTIAGTAPLSKTYTSKRDLMTRVILPLDSRLAQKIVPTVRSIVAEGDHVVVLWDGKATATDGQRYDALYAWHLMLREGKIVHAISFQDTRDLTDLMQRIAVAK